jgi:hypothetical protein
MVVKSFYCGNRYLDVISQCVCRCQKFGATPSSFRHELSSALWRENALAYRRQVEGFITEDLADIAAGKTRKNLTTRLNGK